MGLPAATYHAGVGWGLRLSGVPNLAICEERGVLSAHTTGCVRARGTQERTAHARGEQRTGARATHHDVRNQAEMGWRPDEPQPPLRSWAFKRALGHQGTGAVAFDQGSRVQHCLASASPGRPPLLRPATWAGGGHAPCSQGNSNCVPGTPHMHWVRRLMSGVCPGLGGSRPAGQSRASPPLLHGSCAHGPPGSQRVRPQQVGGPGPGSLLAKEGPLSTVQSAWPPFSSSQSSSCPAFRPLPLWSPQSPVITLFLTFRPQSKQFTWAPVTPPLVHVHAEMATPARHNQHQALTSGPPDLCVPLQRPLLKHRASPSLERPPRLRPWISPGVALTVPPCEALRPPPGTCHPLQTLPPVSQHRRTRIRPKKVLFCPLITTVWNNA